MTELRSFVLTSAVDTMLRDAIDEALRAEPRARAALFEQRLTEIAEFSRATPGERSCRFQAFDGTDGSRIFRGGTGRAVVVDPAGAMWKARAYEDFDITYAFEGFDCRVDTMTPHYAEMRPLTASTPSPDR